MSTSKLTKRELEVAELIAWGCTADEAADKLCISPFTVKNTLRNIYAKLGINKTTELGAYIFCRRYGVSAVNDKLGHVKRAIGASMLLILFLIQMFVIDNEIYRCRRGRRRQEYDCYELI